MNTLIEKAEKYLSMLCNQIPNRRTGSEGNRAATAFFSETLQSFGFDVECPEFECTDWRSDGAAITANGITDDVQVSPYSLGGKAGAPLITACSVTELETFGISNKILLMRGELTREQFLPKNFPFFQVEEQQKIIRLLEEKKPLAIITATSRNPEMAGALYPFPVFEDGDFDIPSVFITEEQGAQLAKFEGQIISLEISSRRIPAHGCNVIARRGNGSKERVVLFAHIDAKLGTPGALDNGSGIVALLLVAEMLTNYAGDKCIEIVALNGEDYYSNPGEQLYLRQNEGKFQEIILGVNIDGLGYLKGKTAYSMYECPPKISALIEQVFADDATFLAGEPWFQGDHALFLMNGRPALALTSELVGELMREYVHTEKDTPEIIDPDKIARTALLLHKLITTLWL
jgi:aminopeptidase YwaD